MTICDNINIVVYLSRSLDGAAITFTNTALPPSFVDHRQPGTEGCNRPSESPAVTLLVAMPGAPSSDALAPSSEHCSW